MRLDRPRLLVAGTGSGVGKTSLTLGLARALGRLGLRVQCFKVGPDYLDPRYLALASGRACYNLDGWMTGRDYVQALAARAGAAADCALIEGVMGLFDGADADGLAGSSAEVAAWLAAPVLLVCNAHGVARSLAAMVKGFTEFEPAVHVAGVIANQAGSDRHRAWLAAALDAARLPPLLGAVPREALPELRSRHLGLVSADAQTVPDTVIDGLADGVARHLDLDRIRALAATAPAIDVADAVWPGPSGNRVRVAFAQDEAFHFYYPDNLELLTAAGADLVPFSPMRDSALPPGIGGLILGGGYPEEHAAALAANAGMRAAVRAVADRGLAVYAECGGLMYLGQTLETRAGEVQPMCGVLPLRTRLLPRLKTLGYVEVETTATGPLGPAGTRLRGHEFHYSEIAELLPGAESWLPAFRASRRREAESQPAGFRRGSVVASYVHLHLGSQPATATAFVDACRQAATERSAG